MSSDRTISTLARWLTGAFAVFIAITAAVNATVNVFSERSPSRALSIQSSAPIALMAIVGKEISDGGLNAKPKPKWEADAKMSLRLQPINAPALRTLALTRQAQGNSKNAMRLMQLSQRVSRRDILTQLWLMQDAVKRDDIHSAMGHIDTALTTHVEIGETVFPVLQDALADQRIVGELATFIRQDRQWLRAFLSFANESNKNPEQLAKAVRLAGGLPAAGDYRDFETDLIWSLSKAGKAGSIPSLLASLKRATPTDLSDGRMSSKTLDPRWGPFSWTASSDPDVSSAINEDNQVAVRAAPMRTGMVLQRLLALREGQYRLDARARIESPEALPVIEIEVGCATGGQAPLLVSRFQAKAQGGALGGIFQVRSGCPIQIVRFVVTGADTGIETEMSLGSISVKNI